MGREMSEIRTRIYGEISNQNSGGLNTYAIILRRAGQRIEASATLERCLAIQEKLDGRDALGATENMVVLARTWAGAGACLEALSLLERVHALRSVSYPADSERLLHPQFLMGQVLRYLGRLREAESATTAVLKLRESVPSTLKWTLAQSQLELAALYRTASRLDAAEGQLVVARETLFQAPSPNRRLEPELLAEEALLLSARGKFDESIKVQISVEEIRAKSHPNHPDTWLQKLDRAETLAKIGQRNAARDLARQISERAKPSIEPTGGLAKRLAKLMV